MIDLRSDFSTASRFFRITGRDGGGRDLAVEARWGCEVLSDGSGEGGLAATPGGESRTSDASGFDPATDHRASAQGNLAGGHSPAWHGGAADPNLTRYAP